MSAFETSRHNAMIGDLVRYGTIRDVDYSNPPRARVDVGDLLSGWLRMAAPRAANDKVWSPYEVGEEVVVLAPSGNLSSGVIIAALYNGTHQASESSANVHSREYQDGASIAYDRAAGSLTIDLNGGTVEIVATGGLEISGDVVVNGDVIASGISLTTHVHGGVMSGGASTGGPQ
ncbi:phage baseplate assembly protein V [Paracoccaceae bacterium GXU_MW_L88]